MKWVDGSKLKCEIDQQIRVLLGPKTEEELMPVGKKQNTPKDKKPESKKSSGQPIKMEKTESAKGKIVQFYFANNVETK